MKTGVLLNMDFTLDNMASCYNQYLDLRREAVAELQEEVRIHTHLCKSNTSDWKRYLSTHTASMKYRCISDSFETTGDLTFQMSAVLCKYNHRLYCTASRLASVALCINEYFLL